MCFQAGTLSGIRKEDATGGHDPDLVPYPRQVWRRCRLVRYQFCELGRSSAAGSRLATGFSPPRDTGTSRNRRQRWLQRLARAGSGETLRLCVDRPQAVELVEASGWDVHEETSLRAAARALIPRESGLPLEAINEHGSLIAALRSGPGG